MGFEATSPLRISKLEIWQFRWRGWILSGLFLILFYSRFLSDQKLNPIYLILVFCGLAYRFSTCKYIGSHTNNLFLSGKTLSRLGPYRWGRHPLYLANLLIAGGFIFYANCFPLWASLSIFGVIFFHHLFLIRTEEKYLLQIHGRHFQDYCDSTTMWIGIPRSPIGSITSNVNTLKWVQVFINQWGNLFKTLMMLVFLWLPEMFR